MEESYLDSDAILKIISMVILFQDTVRKKMKIWTNKPNPKKLEEIIEYGVGAQILIDETIKDLRCSQIGSKDDIEKALKVQKINLKKTIKRLKKFYDSKKKEETGE